MHRLTPAVARENCHTLEMFGCWTLEGLAMRLRVEDRHVYQHGLEALAKQLPIYSALKRSDAWRPFASVVNHWRPAWRYDPNKVTAQQAADFVEAVDYVYHWLDVNRY